MNIKRVNVKFLSFLLIGMFMFSFGVGLVSAAGGEGILLGNELNEFFSEVGGFFSAATGIERFEAGGGAITKILFGVLLYFIIFSTVKSIGMFESQSHWIQYAISGTITLISFFGLPAGFLQSLSSTYGAMGAAMLVVIPFLIMIYFTTHVENLFIARLSWLIFAGYYFVIYVQRIIELSSSGGGIFSIQTLPYLLGIITGIIAFFGFSAIRRLISHGEIDGIKEKAMTKAGKRKAGMEALDANIEGVTGVDMDSDIK